jgi:hypothetical protein
MRIVGRRQEPGIDFHASSEKLRTGALFNDETHKIRGGKAGIFTKGVYRYKTHQEANEHWEASLIRGIVDKMSHG